MDDELKGTAAYINMNGRLGKFRNKLYFFCSAKKPS